MRPGPAVTVDPRAGVPSLSQVAWKALTPHDLSLLAVLLLPGMLLSILLLSTFAAGG